MMRTSPVAPHKLPLEEMSGSKLTHLYEADEQGGHIATTFDNRPKMLGHIIHLLSLD